MKGDGDDSSSKIPAVTPAFWALKILATTLGETGGDAVTMSMGLGYLLGTGIFATAFVVMVAAQVRAGRFNPWRYWATIIATTTLGTTLADFADRTLGIGYAGGSALLLSLLLLSLFAWRRSSGSISIGNDRSPTDQLFYWATIMFSQTLGTALGDWTTDDSGLGYGGSALLFGCALALVAAAYCGTRLSRIALFWTAFVLTRPLGAVVGDLLDKPIAHGGLALSRYTATAALLAAMVASVYLLQRRDSLPAP